MNNPELPKLERHFSKGLILFFKVYFYLVAIPIGWIYRKIGKEKNLIIMSQKNFMIKGGASKAFENYIPTSHDIFVATFAKSGTNWMMQLAHQVVFHGAGEYEHIHDVIPWPDINKNMQKRVCIPMEDTLVQQASPEKLRVIKTHLSAQYTPYNEQAHYIVVLRDPKEVFVSSYYFALSSYGPMMTGVQAWFEMFFTEHFPMNFGSTWAEHTASYWALKDKPNVLVLTYGEMKQDLASSVQKVADSLGVELTENELIEIVKRSSFDYMKDIDHKFTPVPKGVMPWGDGFEMMRSGNSGNSKELITLEQQKMIDEHCQNELKELGSDLPYSELFSIA